MIPGDDLAEARDCRMIDRVYRLGYEHGRRAGAATDASVATSEQVAPIVGHGLRLIHGDGETTP